MRTRSVVSYLLPLLGLAACSPAAETGDPTGPTSARALAAWSARRAIPAGGEVRAAAIAATASRIYVIAGNAGFATTTDLNRIYNPATDRWSLGAKLPSPRDFGMAATLSDGVHFLGGVGPSGLAPEHWVYSTATNAWTPRAPLPLLVDAAVSRVVNNRLYIIGGGSAAGPSGAVQIYDPATDSWSTGAPMPTPRLSTANGVLGRRILVVGGQTAGIGTTDVLEVYDTQLNQWSTLPALPPGPREALGGGIQGGKLCVFGGRIAQGNPSGIPYPETFCYTPRTMTWAQGPDMLTPRVEVASIEFGGGIYAIGGRNAASFGLVTNEVFK